MDLLAREFVQKKLLPAPFRAQLIKTAAGEEALALEHPVALARFVAFAKSKASKYNADVLMRGQDEDYPGMIPSVFRGDPANRQSRMKAYAELLAKAPALLGYTRFRRENLGAVLQHYGFRTPWLDVVDNLYTAIWFALHSRRTDANNRPYYTSSPKRYGWIYLVATRRPGVVQLFCIDLRKHHSSMNVRLHAQHGFAVASQEDMNPAISEDYGPNVIARIRIPNSSQFTLRGALARTAFLFPGPDIDESLQLLLDSSLPRLLSELEISHGLPNGDLGRIDNYRLRRPASRSTV